MRRMHGMGRENRLLPNGKRKKFSRIDVVLVDARSDMHSRRKVLRCSLNDPTMYGGDASAIS